MKAVIVGGTGFVGKSFADWASRGTDIDCVVLASRQPEQTAGYLFLNTVGRSSKVTIEKIGTPKFWDHVHSSDVIIYAASSSDARVYAAGQTIVSSDITNLCAYIDRHPPRIPFLYLSSGAVYGAQPASVDQISELQAPWPDPPSKAVYAGIKREAEKYVRVFGDKHGCDVKIARLFAFCGAWLPTDQHFLVGNLVNAIETKSLFRFRARYPVIRSYLGADQLSLALFALISTSTPEKVFNVGSPTEYLMQDKTSELCNIYELPMEIARIDRELKNTPDRYVPDVGRLAKYFNIKIYDVDFQSLIEETVSHRARLGLG